MGAESANQTTAPSALRVERWEKVAGLAHAFLGRRGGAGKGAFDSLNLSEQVGDDPANVAENWRVVGRAHPALRFVRMRQVHGARVLEVREAAAVPPACDATMTEAAGLGLAVLTADCVPILMVAVEHRVAIAVHAGWRGTLAGIVCSAVETAGTRFGLRACDLWAALGPAIGACCYEVDAEIGRSIESRWGAMPQAWTSDGRKGRLDLRRANRQMLVHAGVPDDRIDEVGPCTACAFDEFFSHRRSGGRTGRQLSLVGWTKSKLSTAGSGC